MGPLIHVRYSGHKRFTIFNLVHGLFEQLSMAEELTSNEGEGILPVTTISGPKKRRSFTIQQKLEALMLLEKNGNLLKTARELNMNRRVLQRWQADKNNLTKTAASSDPKSLSRKRLAPKEMRSVEEESGRPVGNFWVSLHLHFVQLGLYLVWCR